MSLEVRNAGTHHVALGGKGIVPPSMEGVTRMRFRGADLDDHRLFRALGLPVRESMTALPYMTGNVLVVNVDGFDSSLLEKVRAKVKAGLNGVDAVDFVYDNNTDNPPEWVS